MRGSGVGARACEWGPGGVRQRAMQRAQQRRRTAHVQVGAQGCRSASVRGGLHGSSGAGQTEMMYRDTANEVTAMATADHAFHMLRSNTWRERQIDPASNAQVSHL